MHPEYVELPAPARDPAKAKALMAEAGHADTELDLISLDDDLNRTPATPSPRRSATPASR